MLGFVYGAVAGGWFVRSYVRTIPAQARYRILTSLVAAAVLSATVVNFALSPPS